MLVKRYIAKDMAAAMADIKRELGSDAVILSNQTVKQKGVKNWFKKPMLEVMVAYEPEKTPFRRVLEQQRNRPPASSIYAPQLPPSVPAAAEAEQPAAAPSAPADTAAAQVNTSDTEEKLKALDKRLDSLDNMISGFINKFNMVKRDVTYDYPEGIEPLVVKLIENQVREELAHNIASDAAAILGRQSDATAGEVMRQLILEQLGASEPISHKKFKRRIVLVLGPTGVGKTTSIVKLAANFSIKQKKKVGIINTDSYRIGAQEQLRTYADILDMPVKMIYSNDELEEALAEMEDRDIVFIDTAGKKPGDEAQHEDISGILTIAEPDDILLCVSLATSFSSMREIIDAYGFTEDYRLLVTKLDETKFRGMLLNLIWYAKRRVAYVTTGQTVPDDIEPLDPEAIAGELLS